MAKTASSSVHHGSSSLFAMTDTVRGAAPSSMPNRVRCLSCWSRMGEGQAVAIDSGGS